MLKTMKEYHTIIRINDVCRNCLGEGVAIVQRAYDYGHGHKQNEVTEICKVCEGSGLVVVEKDITIKITPKKN
jgi:hypothetical protein